MGTNIRPYTGCNIRENKEIIQTFNKGFYLVLFYYGDHLRENNQYFPNLVFNTNRYIYMQCTMCENCGALRYTMRPNPNGLGFYP